MAPQVLQRISIRWVPGHAHEDTDTIALNVGGYFIDLRIWNTNGAIQWCRAGERKVVNKNPFTYQWTRIIDSTGVLDPDEATWDGDKLGNGDAFEAGTAVCPSRNDELTPYEEIWRDIIRKGPLTSSWILQSEDGATFLGLVGGTFLGIRSNSDGTFGARREEWDPEQKSWSFKLERGHCLGLPEVEAVLKEINAEDLRVGGTVAVAGVNYAIRAHEDTVQ